MSFKDDVCSIKDNETGAQFISVMRAGNNMFLFYTAKLGRANVAAKDLNLSILWHQ